MAKFYTVCLGIVALLLGNAVAAPMPMPINRDMGDGVYARLTDSSLHVPRSYIMVREYGNLYARKTPAPPAEHSKPAAPPAEHKKAADTRTHQQLHRDAAVASEAARMAEMNAKNAAVNNGWGSNTANDHNLRATQWSGRQTNHNLLAIDGDHNPAAARQTIKDAELAKASAEAATAKYNQEKPPSKGIRIRKLFSSRT